MVSLLTSGGCVRDNVTRITLIGVMTAALTDCIDYVLLTSAGRGVCVCVCGCVCVCVCLSVCLSVCLGGYSVGCQGTFVACVYILLCGGILYVHIYICVCCTVCVCVCVCSLYAHVHLYLYLCFFLLYVCVYMYVCGVYACLCVCMYVCVRVRVVRHTGDQSH